MASTFQARHYTALARELHKTYAASMTDAGRSELEQAAKQLATMFRSDNPNFNAERWFEAVYEGKGIRGRETVDPVTGRCVGPNDVDPREVI